MPGTQPQSGKPYLSIVGGEFKQKVNEGTPKAVFRKWELKDGTKGEKWELVYKDWTGSIRKILFEQSQYGEACKIELDDVVISLATDSRYFQDFGKKIFNADLTKKITLSPYDFEGDDGKQVKGLTVSQDGNKISNYFYDPNKKKNLHDFPEPQEENMQTDDWKVYFINVKKFLVEKVGELKIPVGETAGEPELGDVPEEEIPDLKSLPF